MSNHPIVQPVQSLHPAVHNRRELRDLQSDHRQFSLYILSLRELMKEHFNVNDFSYPSIAGIHGQPYVEWGSSGPETSDTQFGGYCTHGSVLFPTWHRVYTLLFEQALFAKANEIAKQYPTERDEWSKAADALRSPYWDWAHAGPGKPQVPSVLVTPSISITTPEGVKEVDNPLYTYKFLDVSVTNSFGDPWHNWKTTLRYPTNENPDAKSNMAGFNDWFVDDVKHLRNEVYMCLTRNPRWETFSNHSATDEPVGVNSLETIHDQVHEGIGGSETEGHMAIIPVAAFDASFFLHHTNVDRLLSLWQALHPDLWVIPGPQPNGTFTIADGATVNVDSDLTPFWNTQSTYWKSTEVKSTDDLLYTYPEFNGLEKSSPQQVKKAIMEQVDALYGHHLFVPKPKPMPSGRTPRTWNLHIRFKKYEFGSSFGIDVLFDGQRVASVASFASRRNTPCANCQNNINLELDSFVHLTELFYEKEPSLHSLDLEHVRPLLERITFVMRGRKEDGSPADIDHDLPSLKVLPYSQDIIDPDSSFPRLGNVVHYPGVLRGRLGQLPYSEWALPSEGTA